MNCKKCTEAEAKFTEVETNLNNLIEEHQLLKAQLQLVTEEKNKLHTVIDFAAKRLKNMIKPSF